MADTGLPGAGPALVPHGRQLEGEPLTVLGSARQLVAHPLVGECRQSRNAIAALLARVGLEDPLAADRGGSGSRTTSQSARRAALTRHHGRA